jgi:hypothetical protein
LQFLWPFSDRAWVYPIVSYGDLGTTAIFLIEMFVLYRWQARAQLIACASLLLVRSLCQFALVDEFRIKSGFGHRRNMPNAMTVVCHHPSGLSPYMTAFDLHLYNFSLG